MKTIEIKGTIGFPENYKTEEEVKDFRNNQLKDITESKDKIINVKIDSLGGDVNHAISVRNALANNPANIEIEFIGWSASAATIIATAGKVTAAENIMILPHEARGGVKGVKSDIQSYAEWLDKTNSIIAGMYSEKTGAQKTEMLEMMSKNNGEGEWLTAQEAKEIGLIDEVYEPMQAAANVELGELPGIPEDKLTIINQINMNIFKKKEEGKPVNSILLGEVIAVYEGDLAKNTKLIPTNGAVLENGEYTLGEKVLVVKDMEIEEVKEEVPENNEEMEKKEEEIENLTNANKELEAKLESLTNSVETKEKEVEQLTASLAEVKSTHKTPVKTDVTEVKAELPMNIQVKKMVQEELKKLNKEE